MTAGGKNDALVVFTPSGKRGRFPLGTRLLDAASSLGVDLDSVCGGRALCGRCQVTLPKGNLRSTTSYRGVTTSQPGARPSRITDYGAGSRTTDA